MKLDTLLVQLESFKVNVVSDVDLDGFRVLILEATLPSIPFGDKRPEWYALTLDFGQDEVHDAEIRAILRHFYQAQSFLYPEQDFPEDGVAEHPHSYLIPEYVNNTRVGYRCQCGDLQMDEE